MTRSRRAFVIATGLAFAALGAAPAGANGRFPRAQRVVERGGSANELVLSATYGLLLGADGGREWRHVCELGFAFAVAEIDPTVGFFSDGSMLVMGTRSLNRAEPPYCAFEPVLGGPASRAAVDFSIDAADGNRALALVMLRGDTGMVENQLFETSDAARTFTELGEPLPVDDVEFGLTLDAAPSDSRRLYVSATARDGSKLFARSDDRGSTWTTNALPLAAEEYPYIAAIDPANADAIYLRTDLWEPNAEGVYRANDALFYSEDGGASFREIHRAAGKLFGFALSPDGAKVLVGYGDPVEPSRSVDAPVLGIYRASTTDFAFSKIYEGPVSCLAWTANGVYACTSQVERGFALGAAPNADFELDTESPLAPLLDLRAVAGPLECPACTSGAACLPLWAQACAVFESCDAGTPRAGSGGVDCPPAGGGGGGPPAGTGGPAREDTRSGDSSCGCRTAASGGGAAAVASGLFLGALLVRRRRGVRAALAPGNVPQGDY